MVEKQIGDYKVLEYIGSGGMAKVYLAVHREIPNLKVVLKVLTHPQHAERFKQEADKLAFLDGNPHICKIRHFFNHGDEFVIAMEYIDGPALEEILKHKGKMSIPESLDIVLDILSALEPAHEQGIYHRDIKPSNIMFSKRGEVKIIDFGIAKGKSDPKLTVVGTAAGTPEYMAPEQFGASEEIDYARCDIYAVGTMLYRMVTGAMPFTGDNEFLLRDAKLFNAPDAPSKLNRDIRRELDEIILTAIQTDPGKRYASVAEMKERIARVRGTYGAAAAAGEAALIEPAPPKKPRRGSPRARIVLAVVSLAVVAAAALFVAGRIRLGDGSVRLDPATTAVPGAEAPPEGPGLDAAAPAGERATDAVPAANGAAAERAGDAAGSRIEPVPPAGTGAHVPAQAAPARPAKGELRVGSRPHRGRIFINGVAQGQTTPYTFSLDPGRYAIRIIVSVDGAERTYNKSVTVESNRTAVIFWNAEENN